MTCVPMCRTHKGQAKEQAFSSQGSCSSGSPQLLNKLFQHPQGSLHITSLPPPISPLSTLTVLQALGGMCYVLTGLSLLTNLSQAPQSSHCPAPVHACLSSCPGTSLCQRRGVPRPLTCCCLSHQGQPSKGFGKDGVSGPSISSRSAHRHTTHLLLSL